MSDNATDDTAGTAGTPRAGFTIISSQHAPAQWSVRLVAAYDCQEDCLVGIRFRVTALTVPVEGGQRVAVVEPAHDVVVKAASTGIAPHPLWSNALDQ